MRTSHRAAGPAFLEAIKVPAGAFTPGAAVTYTVVEKKAQGSDKRAEARKRTRLRSGKVLDTKNKFLIECLVHDRSPQGARLRLVANVSAPNRIRLFDDESKVVRDARVVWRNNQDLGVRFMTTIKADTLRPAERAALDGKYYAI